MEVHRRRLAWQPDYMTADLDHNDRVDLNDLALFAAQWLRAE